MLSGASVHVCATPKRMALFPDGSLNEAASQYGGTGQKLQRGHSDHLSPLTLVLLSVQTPVAGQGISLSRGRSQALCACFDDV